MPWYLRSMADRDPHLGAEANGIVASLCGAVFTPLPLPYNRIALPGHPQEPDQICPDCDGKRRTRR